MPSSFIQTILSALEFHQISTKKALAGFTAGGESHPALKTNIFDGFIIHPKRHLSTVLFTRKLFHWEMSSPGTHPIPPLSSGLTVHFIQSLTLFVIKYTES